MLPVLDIKVDLIKQQKKLFEKIFCKKDNTWKIIILDQANLDVVSSLFRKRDFYQNNITLNFEIKKQRDQIHGVTVVYLIKPTAQNIQLIIKDFQRDLYSSVIIHFSYQPLPHLLSNFAKDLSKKKSSAISRIQKIQYSNVQFQCIDRQMCILSSNNQLINLLVMLKNQPIFIYGQQQQDFVLHLKERLSQSAFHLKNQDSEDASLSSIKKPKKYTKVLLFNRQIDYFPIFSHGITYAGLMEDIWQFNQSGNRIIDKDYKIDLNDEIWLERKNMMISQMQLQKECNKIKVKLENTTTKMQQHSELQQKQKKIEWHLSRAQQMIKQAKRRRLDEFHAVEEEIYIKKMLSGETKKQFIELLQTAPQSQDKDRLILAYMGCAQNYDQNQVQELQRAYPDIKKNDFYNSFKNKKCKSQSQQNANSKYIKKMAKGFWKNLVNQEKKYMLIKYLQKTKDLAEKNLNQLGLKMSALKQIPLNAQIQHSVVYVDGGICFNQYANLALFDPNVLYTGRIIKNYREFI